MFDSEGSRRRSTARGEYARRAVGRARDEEPDFDDYYERRRPRRRVDEYEELKRDYQSTAEDEQYDEVPREADVIDIAQERPARSRFADDRSSRNPRQERSMRISSEDSFYEQMNTFRDRAQKLQDLINEKQEQVDYLEDVLDDMEDENRRLRDELDKSRASAGDYAVDIEEQVNRLSEILGADLDEMEERISERIDKLPQAADGEMQEITIDTEPITTGFDAQQKRMDETFASISERLEDIIANQEKLHKKIEENQGSDNAESTREQLNEIFSDQKSFFSNTMLTQEKKMTESLNSMDNKLEGMKNELSDKIHSEDVKVYRNLQDYIKEQDHHEEDSRLLVSRYKALRNREYINMVLTVINIILGAFFLYIIS